MEHFERSWLRRLAPREDGLAVEGRGSARQLLALDLPGLPGSADDRPAAGAAPPEAVRIAVVGGQVVDLSGYALEGASMTVQGADLVLVGADGSVVILQGFVTASDSTAPPMLLMADGAAISGDRLIRGGAPERDGAARGEGDAGGEAAGGEGGSEGDGGAPRSQTGPQHDTGLTVVAGSFEGAPPVLPAMEVLALPSGLSTGLAAVPRASVQFKSSESAPVTVQPQKAALSGSVTVKDITFDGVTASSNLLDTSTVTPFASFTIQYDAAATPLNISVTLSNAGDGAFTAGSLTASGFVDAGGGVYSYNGTAAAAQTAIRQLAFDPTDNASGLGLARTTTLTVAGDDGGSGSTQDANTKVTATQATGTAGVDNVTLPIAVGSGTVDLGAAADSLTLADGTNSLVVSNVETINGGTGTDTVALGTIGSVTVTALESLTGTVGDDTVNVAQADFAVMTDLDGGTGTDVLAFSNGGSFDLSALNSLTRIESVTTSGATMLTLRDGIDLTVTLDNAANTVTGGSGADSITGGSAADTLDGGSGSDRLAGGGGADRFVFAVADTQGVVGLADVLTDFTDGSDIIAISGVADFDAMNGSDFADLSVTEVVNAGGLIDGQTDTVVTDQTSGKVIAVLDGVSAGTGDTIDAADFVITA